MSMSRKVIVLSTAYDKKGNIIAISKNFYNRSHPYQKMLSVQCGLSEERIYLHSEVACLLKAKNMRKQVHTLKVERYGRRGEMRLAFPCESCQTAIKLAGVKRVIFTTEEGWRTWIV